MIFPFMSLAALWLIGHLVVKRRFVMLNTNLSDIYRSAFAVPTSVDTPPQLVALCVDLMRKQHCNLPFDALTPKEKRMVLHAHAANVLPNWMSRYAALWLPAEHRRLVGQLRDIKTSRPDLPKQHFGAIKRQLQLRSATKS
ncbi:MAG: hypothetical protein AAFN63_10425 [Pseudomonadota bacterium]